MVTTKQEAQPGKQVLFYDCKRDKGLQEGEAILVYEDGHRERVSLAEFDRRVPALPPMETTKDYWSPGGQVFFTGRVGFGVTGRGKTICLGLEADVLRAIADSKLKCGNPEVDGVIELEREIQNIEREANYGRANATEAHRRASKVSGRGVMRVRLVHNLRHFRQDYRPTKARPGPTLRQPKQKQSGFPDGGSPQVVARTAKEVGNS